MTGGKKNQVNGYPVARLQRKGCTTGKRKLISNKGDLGYFPQH